MSFSVIKNNSRYCQLVDGGSWIPEAAGSSPARETKQWGMGLLGVVTSLAPRSADRFDADILHQN